MSPLEASSSLLEYCERDTLAMESLVKSLAWEITWQLSGAADRRNEEEILEAGKADLLKRPIMILAHRGKLSYGEYLKYSAMGIVGVESTALSTKYDACGLRKVFTLGLSPCKWDTDYR